VWGDRAHHFECVCERLILLRVARPLEQRREVEEDRLDVRELLECAAQHPDALAGRIGVTIAQPAMRDDAGAATALANECDRLVGGEQRRRRGSSRLERLEILPIAQPKVLGLCEQPLRTQEAHVAALQGPDQLVVELCEGGEDLGRQCHIISRGNARRHFFRPQAALRCAIAAVFVC
jgi:hypothetical protein